MANYVVPQVLVFQDLQLVPQADIRPLPAHISGGHAYLVRESEADEKAEGNLGFYNSTLEECFLWPNRPAGGIADTTYTQVFMDGALLRYFEDFIGAGDQIDTVATKANQVRAAATSFKENGTSFPRDADLQDRDVTIGDIAKVRAVVGATTYTLWTYVAGFIAEVIAAVVAASTSDSDNQATQGAPVAAATYTGLAALVNCIDVASINQTTYDGLEDGDVNETYTITVIDGSAGNDATTAKLRITSASGNDDIATDISPAAFGAATTIGSRGLTVTFSDTDTAACSLSADNNMISDIDFIPGQSWQVTCGQAFTAPVSTSGGTYTGDDDVVYIVEVTKGGLYATSPEITVTTDKGIDASGPTAVTAAASAVVIGTKAVTLSFDATALNKGDRYFVTATAESDGAIQTLELGHNLDDLVQANGATEVDLTLYIKKDIEVSEQRADTPGIVNWDQSDTEICLKSGVTALDSSWTLNGVPEPLPVFSESTQGYGDLFLTARYWESVLCADVTTISDISEIEAAITGPLHPDNPLKWAVSKAVANSNGTPVTFTSVCNPAVVDDWTTVIELIDGRDDTYGLVPLTRDVAVLNNFQAHVSGQSSATFGRWRVLWVNLPGVDSLVVADETNSTDAGVILATLSDDPNTTGTQFTLLEVPAGNSSFVANGTRAGDIVRYLFTTDGFGGTVWTEFVIDAVLNESTLRLVDPGNAAAINVAQKVEVHRNLTATEQATEISTAHGFSDRRVRAVWPDVVGSGGQTFPGYHLCAALAGLSSGVVPHQGLTHLEIDGFDDLSRTDELFNRTQLNIMAGAGVWVVTKDPQSGAVFSRHALTTADYDDISEREESITRNLDSISYFFLDLFAPYIGVSNVTNDLLVVLRAEMAAGIQTLRGRNFVERIGSQLIDAEIIELRPHTTLKDRVVARVNLDLPFALNNLELHLIA